MSLRLIDYGGGWGAHIKKLERCTEVSKHMTQNIRPACTYEYVEYFSQLPWLTHPLGTILDIAIIT
jgi:hypothetical protein